MIAPPTTYLRRDESAPRGSRTAQRSSPLEVEEEPPRPSDDTQLIDDACEDEEDENDDGDEAARLLRNVVRRESVDGDPREGHLHRSERVSESLAVEKVARSQLTLIRVPTQKPPRYQTVRSRIAPSNAGSTQRKLCRQKALATKRAGRKYLNPVETSAGGQSNGQRSFESGEGTPTHAAWRWDPTRALRAKSLGRRWTKRRPGVPVCEEGRATVSGADQPLR